ncbi:MAG: NADAR family protein, partial [Clostridia bacterium]|nr:NADAR family protein [Clostridia bacterium]
CRIKPRVILFALKPRFLVQKNGQNDVRLYNIFLASIYALDAVSFLYARAMDLGNLGILAPHKAKYYNRYDINWLSDKVDEGTELRYITFWKADPCEENNIFSQWYKARNPIYMNGRTYITAEQYMMSEKALLFQLIEPGTVFRMSPPSALPFADAPSCVKRAKGQFPRLPVTRKRGAPAADPRSAPSGRRAPRASAFVPRQLPVCRTG